jgi:hypothetical protein
MNRNALIRFPLDGKVKSVDEKLFIMIQSYLANISFTDPKIGFLMEVQCRKLNQMAQRIIKGVIEFVKISKCGISLANSLELHKSLNVRCWDLPNQKHLQLKQIEKIGPV